MEHLIQKKKFSDIDISKSFFNSLKEDYKEFEDWFKKKAEKGDEAYIFEDEIDSKAFLYLKLENEELKDVIPNLDKKSRLKIGTFKVDAHGTKLGERFLKKIFDHAVNSNVDEIYVTIFPKHDMLIKLIEKYGFYKAGKKTTHNGTENVYIKNLKINKNDILLNYPKITMKESKYLLSIYPLYHSRLFPDSILDNEKFDVIKDVSHTNSIHKIYICFMDLKNLKNGDKIIIYRTKDDKGPAWYRSVITSVCIVEELKNKSHFKSEREFVDYCAKYSVFSESELRGWYSKNTRLNVIKMTYNIAFSKRMNRKFLIENIGLNESDYWGFMELSDEKFNQIIKKGGVNEGYIID